MVIKTDYVGDVEYSEKDVVHMDKGVYGFEDQKGYLLIDHPDPDMPYMWLQSLDDENVCFIVTNPFYFVEDYDFDIADATIERLGIDEIEDVLILSMVVIPEVVKDTTINLQSPIIMNKNLMKAEQVILEEKFPIKHKLFEKGVE